MINNLFGKILRQLREERNISQSALGKILGFCNQTVSCWESGKREPDLDTLVEIAKYFEVTVDFLLGISDC